MPHTEGTKWAFIEAGQGDQTHGSLITNDRTHPYKGKFVLSEPRERLCKGLPMNRTEYPYVGQQDDQPQQYDSISQHDQQNYSKQHNNDSNFDKVRKKIGASKPFQRQANYARRRAKVAW